MARICIPLLLLAGCSAPGSRRVDPEDREQMELILVRQARAWNRGDLEAFVADYAPDLTFVSGDQVLRGRAALLERYETSYPAGQRGELRFDELSFRRLGPDAYLALGRWQLRRPPDDPHGRFTLVFERDASGDLRIQHDHSSGAAD